MEKAINFFKENKLSYCQQRDNGSNWLVVKFDSERQFDEFTAEIGKYMNFGMEFICATNELWILI